jgi:hypothetical protein
LKDLQATDKEAFLARFMSVERTLKESISRQLAAEKDLDVKIVAHTAHVSQMISQVDARMKKGEVLLREQVESAMSRLRAYARDVEEDMGQVCSNPWLLKPAKGSHDEVPVSQLHGHVLQQIKLPDLCYRVWLEFFFMPSQGRLLTRMRWHLCRWQQG